MHDSAPRTEKPSDHPQPIRWRTGGGGTKLGSATRSPSARYVFSQVDTADDGSCTRAVRPVVIPGASLANVGSGVHLQRLRPGGASRSQWGASVIHQGQIRQEFPARRHRRRESGTERRHSSRVAGSRSDERPSQNGSSEPRAVARLRRQLARRSWKPMTKRPCPSRRRDRRQRGAAPRHPVANTPPSDAR